MKNNWFSSANGKGSAIDQAVEYILFSRIEYCGPESEPGSDYDGREDNWDDEYPDDGEFDDFDEPSHFM